MWESDRFVIHLVIIEIDHWLEDFRETEFTFTGLIWTFSYIYFALVIYICVRQSSEIKFKINGDIDSWKVEVCGTWD